MTVLRNVGVRDFVDDQKEGGRGDDGFKYPFYGPFEWRIVEDEHEMVYSQPRTGWLAPGR